MRNSIKYLIPVSDSPGSRNAMTYGLDFFSGMNAEGFLLHILEDLEVYQDSFPFFESLEDPAIPIKQQLREIVRKGEVVDEIIKASSDIDPHLIVIGSKGENIENRFFASKHTTEIVVTSSYPVLIIPPDISYSPVNTIVLATDMKTNNISLVQEMLHLFRNLRCAIHMLILPAGKMDWHYKEEVKLLVDSLRNYWDYDKIFVSILETDNILIQLEMFLKEHKADVLAFDKSNSRFQKIFFQNPDNQMPCCTDLPILALPGNR